MEICTLKCLIYLYNLLIKCINIGDEWQAAAAATAAVAATASGLYYCAAAVRAKRKFLCAVEFMGYAIHGTHCRRQYVCNRLIGLLLHPNTLRKNNKEKKKKKKKQKHQRAHKMHTHS